jgi:hypothetical protein
LLRATLIRRFANHADRCGRTRIRTVSRLAGRGHAAPGFLTLAQRLVTISESLNMDSGDLCEQQLKQGSQQRFAALSYVMHKRKEAQRQRSIVLRDAAMRAKPRAEQRPKALHRVDVHLMQAIAIIVPRIFAAAMTHTGMLVAPLLHAAVNVVCIRVHRRAGGTCRSEQRFDRRWLDVCQPPHDHLTTTLEHPKDRGLLCGERPTSALTLEPSAPSSPPLFTTCSGLPLWPATMETSAPSTSFLQVGDGFLVTSPCRNWQVL